MKKYIKLLAVIIVAFSTQAYACRTNQAKFPCDEITANKRVMEKMHEDMMIDYTGNADIDFVRGMVPHHQGAVNMAKVELEFGKDPELRELAKDIIDSQNKEIEFMKIWQAEHDKGGK